jgi:spore coat protein U-like protein
MNIIEKDHGGGIRGPFQENPERMKRFIAVQILVMIAGFLCVPSTGMGGTSSTGLNVSIDVNAECIVSASQVDFGDFAGTSNVSTTGALSVQCTIGVPYSVHLGGGSHPTANGRQLADVQGVNFLLYELFKDIAHTTKWGGTDYIYGSPLNATGNGVGQGYTLYGVLYKPQISLPPGLYKDVVQVVVSW